MLLGACSTRGTSSNDLLSVDPDAPEIVEELPDDYFDLQNECSNAWRELVLDWRANGGGVKSSVRAMRQQVASDHRSIFASFVRKSWESQALEDAQAMDKFGKWPVSTSESRRLSGVIEYPQEMNLPEDCQALAWLHSLLWEDLQNPDGSAASRLQEVPPDMNWESPFAQQWLTYWLFVRVEEGS